MLNVAAGRASAGSAREGTGGTTGRGETTVLVVDDHRIFADLLSATLQTVPGIRCLGTAASATEGIERVAELSPSVVVMELEVLGYIGAGLPAKSIAKVMGVSVHTCLSHIKSLYDKLRVSSRIAAVNSARRLQLLLSSQLPTAAASHEKGGHR
jgi:DNA-binding NarL/FixJ family response regulator